MGSNPLKFRSPSKIVPKSTRLWKLSKIAEFRTPTPQYVRKKGSKIKKKLPPVRNCFTLAMTNKLVVIINNLKLTKIEKILLYWMKFLVSNYSGLQNPWLGGYHPQIPVLSVLNWICWNPPRKKILGTPLVAKVHALWTYCLFDRCISEKGVRTKHYINIYLQEWKNTPESPDVCVRIRVYQKYLNLCRKITWNKKARNKVYTLLDTISTSASK